jgi:hypothetical protein
MRWLKLGGLNGGDRTEKGGVGGMMVALLRRRLAFWCRCRGCK